MKGFREVKRNSKNMNNLKENYISWREKKNDIIIQFYLFSIVFFIISLYFPFGFNNDYIFS